MNEKIIIENRSRMDMTDVIFHVRTVMKKGKISKTSKGKQYCFATTFPDRICVYADKNKKSDKFIIIDNLRTETYGKILNEPLK